MNHQLLKIFKGLAGFFILMILISFTPEDEKIWHKAQQIAKEITMIDCHSHDLFKPVSKRFPKQIDSAMLEKSGVNVVVQSYPLNPRKNENIWKHIQKEMHDIDQKVADRNSKYALVLNSRDCNKNKDKVKLILAMEYFHGLTDGKVENLKTFYDKGFRVFGLFNGGNDSVYIKTVGTNYLSPFGKQLIKEMNRLGMMCDITHLPENIRRECIEASEAPLCVSHSNVRSVVKSDFNVSDTTLKMLTDKGGIICLTFCSDYVSEDYREQLKSGIKRSEAILPDMEKLMDHIDYLKANFGIDHIGIGSDFGGSGRLAPKGLETIEGFPLFIYYMLKRGYSKKEIRKVMGLNFIRYFEHVEKAAEKM